jgi:hypothetical protein
MTFPFLPWIGFVISKIVIIAFLNPGTPPQMPIFPSTILIHQIIGLPLSLLAIVLEASLAEFEIIRNQSHNVIYGA